MVAARSGARTLLMRTLLPLLLLSAVGLPRLEVAFELPGTTGNPFDYRDNDVQVTFAATRGAGAGR